MRRGRRIAVILLLVAAVALVARQGRTVGPTTYYVDPVTGNDVWSGTSPTFTSGLTGPWKTVPGTRNTANTAFLRTAWGAIDGSLSFKIFCGDTILLKGGATAGTATVYSTATVPSAGGWCIAGADFAAFGPIGCAKTKQFYAGNCSKASPITVTIATNAEWSGSNGDFAVDCAGMTPMGNAFSTTTGTGTDPCISVGGVSGLIFGGISATQRIIVKNLAGTGQNCGIIHATGNTPACRGGTNPGVSCPVGNECTGGGTCPALDTDLDYGWLRSTNHGGCGMAVGNVGQVRVHDAEFDSNGTPGFNTGLQSDRKTVGIGFERINVWGNATHHNCNGFGDAMETQGVQRLVTLNSDIHDNYCSGMNVGAGGHLYPQNDVDIVRDTVFRNNGLAPFRCFKSAGSGGNGFTVACDTAGSTAAPCVNGEVCTQVGPSEGYQGGGDSVPAEGSPVDTPDDAYGTLQRCTFYGHAEAGFAWHHGSGFAACLNCTVLGNGTRLNGAGAGAGGGLFWDQRQGDGAFLNGILLRANNQVPIYRSDSGCAAVGSHVPAGCFICDQRCTNAGTVCTVAGDCPGCTSSGPQSKDGQTSCYGYRPKPVISHSLLVPQAADSESLTDFSFKCDASCGNAGADCRDASDCAACTNGCAFNNLSSGTTFAAPPLFIAKDPSNKIGIAADPRFTAAPAGCKNGTAYASCDLRLTTGSPAIDAGTFYMRANGAGTNVGTMNVQQAPELVAQGLNFNGHLGDPHFFFVTPADYLRAKGDTLQIQNCTQPADCLITITSMTTSAISFTPNASWPANAGISLPWVGSAPDLGALEFGAVSPSPTTTLPGATTTSTSSTSTTSTVVGATTTTTSTTLPRRRLVREEREEQRRVRRVGHYHHQLAVLLRRGEA